MSRERRRRAWVRGRRAERRAAWWLRFKGYRILAQDFRTQRGEIDLVARRGRLLVWVEVKFRPSLQEAGEAIGGRQRRRIERAATTFLQQNPHLGSLDQRFDAVLIAPRHWPRHISDAWRREQKY